MTKIIISSAESRKAFDVFNIVKSKVKDIKLVSKAGKIKRFFLSIVYFRNIETYESIKFLDDSWQFYPIEEEDIEFLYSFKYNFRCHVPEKKQFFNSIDKLNLRKVCEDFDIPYPKTLELRKENIDKLKFPVYIKPRRGMGSKGVKKFNNLDDLENFIASHDIQKFIIQESVESDNGITSGCFFSVNGQIKSYYSHRRILTYPVQNGATVRSRSIIDKEILELGKRYIKKSNWSGLIMFEFLRCKEKNSFYLIEVNPRPWGSIILSDYCDSKLIDNSLSWEHSNYLVKGKSDKVIRWVFPFEILHLIKGNLHIRDLFDKGCVINFYKSNFLSSVLFTIVFVFDLKKIFEK